MSQLGILDHQGGQGAADGGIGVFDPAMPQTADRGFDVVFEDQSGPIAGRRFSGRRGEKDRRLGGALGDQFAEHRQPDRGAPLLLSRGAELDPGAGLDQQGRVQGHHHLFRDRHRSLPDGVFFQDQCPTAVRGQPQQHEHPQRKKNFDKRLHR